MWKLIVGFLLFAALGIWLLMRGGDNIDLGGEKHETSTPHSAEKDAKTTPAVVAPTAVPVTVPKP